MGDAQRVILITADGRAQVKHIVPGGPETAILLGQQYSDHVSLNGLEHRELKLGLFCCDTFQGLPLNKVATRIVKYLKQPMTTQPSTYIRGPAILYEDEGHLTDEVWDLIKHTIRAKRAGQPLPDLVAYARDRIEFMRANPLPMMSPETIRGLEETWNVSRYGAKIRE